MENRLCLNKKQEYHIEDFEICIVSTVKGVRMNNPPFEAPTIRINSWGTKCGRILTDEDRTYAREIWIKCSEKVKEEVLSIDWIDYMEGKNTSHNGSKHVSKTMMPHHLKEELYKRFYGVKYGE